MCLIAVDLQDSGGVWAKSDEASSNARAKLLSLGVKDSNARAPADKRQARNAICRPFSSARRAETFASRASEPGGPTLLCGSIPQTAPRHPPTSVCRCFCPTNRPWTAKGRPLRSFPRSLSSARRPQTSASRPQRSARHSFRSTPSQKLRGPSSAARRDDPFCSGRRSKTPASRPQSSAYGPFWPALRSKRLGQIVLQTTIQSEDATNGMRN